MKLYTAAVRTGLHRARLPHFILMLLLFSVGRIGAIEILWTNTSGGDWSIATNWSPNIVPGSNDNVTIQGVVTVVVSMPSQCAGLNLTNFSGGFPTITGSGALTVYGPSHWRGATFSGTGQTILEAGATLEIAGGFQFTLSSRILENGGTVSWTGSGTIFLNSGAVITNRPGALFEVQSAASFISAIGSGASFDNAGIYRKSLNTSIHTTATSMAFNNYGSMEIQAGTFLSGGPFQNNGTVTLSPGTTNRISGGGSANGTFTTPPTALVEWSSGASTSFTLETGAQLNGSGLYRITVGATVVANADLRIENFELNVGTLDGPGLLTIDNAVNWTGGSMTGSGHTLIPAGVTLSIANPVFVKLATRTLDNAGTVLWTGAGDITLVSGAVITNRPGASFLVQNAAAFSSVVASGSRFDNAGVFRKSINGGTNFVATSLIFNNYALMEIQSGTFVCGGTFINSGTMNLSPGTTVRLNAGSVTGTFNVPDTALVVWDTGTFMLNPGVQLLGTGLYKTAGGTLLGNTDVVVANLDLTGGGVLSGTDTFTVNHVMNWISGTMVGNGRTLIAPTATLSIANPSFLTISARTLDNAGTVVWTGAGNITLTSSAVITNQPGALFEVKNAQPFQNVGACRFDNAGTLRKSANSGTTSFFNGVSLTNYGTIDIRSGTITANGLCTLKSNSLLSCAIGGTNAGTGYGRLQAVGNITINGALSVDFINGFIPTTNDLFMIVTNATRAGGFTNFFYPSNQVIMQMSSSTAFITVHSTGPFIPAPVLLTPVVSGPNVLLSWSAASSANYRVEFNPDLDPANWTALPGDVVATSNIASKSDPLTPSNRFYRVLVLP